MQLIWFRNDLRTNDNTALWHASQAGQVLAIYLATPLQWQKHGISNVQTRFRLRSLQALQYRLKTLGIPLLYDEVGTYQDVPEKLLTIAQEYHCQGLYWNNEYPLDEKRRDQAVDKLFHSHLISCYRFDDLTLLPPGSVVNQSGNPYRVFTPFKNRYLRDIDEATDAGLLPEPDTKAKPKDPLANFETADFPLLLAKLEQTINDDVWPAGQQAAIEQLEHFVTEKISDYPVQRNYPALDGSAKLSHHLAVGTLSIRQCFYAALTEQMKNPRNAEGARTWINELVWRDFYQHLLFHFEDLSRNKPFKPETENIHWRTSDNDFQSWCQGLTGVPLVDAGMRQLTQTGWMHNRVRMITAMFLAKNLLLDWRKGERFFMQHLIDGDFASNNGGWQWCASTGTDAAPYFRVFDPYSQSKKWDADAAYIKAFVPELEHLPAKVIHNAATLAQHKPQHYPEPIVDVKASRKQAIDAFKNLG